MKKSSPSRRCTALAAVCLLLSLAGCSGAPLMVEPIDRGREPLAEIDRLAREVEQDRAQQVDLLSPAWFERAQASLAAARQKAQARAPAEKIFRQLEIARAELRQAEVVAVRSRDQLADAIAAREAARSVGAWQFGPDYAAAEQEFTELTRAVEKDQFEYARQRRARLTGRYRELQVRAIESSALGEVQARLEKARQADAALLAPQSLGQALDALKQAQVQIATDPRDRNGIERKAAQAAFLAQRALVIAQSAGRLAHMAPEQVALQMEALLYETAGRLNEPDQRNRPLEQQQAAILARLDALQMDLSLSQKVEEERRASIQTLQMRLAEEKEELGRTRQELQRISSEKHFLDRYVLAQAMFDPQEADFFFQADQVIIRLKELRFRPGKADLQPADQRLLYKAQQAILIFGRGEVAVQCPEKSGAAAAQQMLYRRRIETVEQYLISGMPSGQVTVLQQPAASAPVVAGAAPWNKPCTTCFDVILRPRAGSLPD